VSVSKKNLKKSVIKENLELDHKIINLTLIMVRLIKIFPAFGNGGVAVRGTRLMSLSNTGLGDLIFSNS